MPEPIVKNRIEEVSADLQRVRTAIRDALDAESMSTGDRSMRRQRIAILREEEGRLARDLRRAMTGSPWGIRTVLRRSR